jgi:sulfofructose kinase
MECMRFASAVSALKCLKLGGRTGIPTRAQVDEFLRSH